jgi:hypothetical protein
MSDPQRFDTLGDWALQILASIVIGIISGLFSAMRWFKGEKKEIDARIALMEKDMRDFEEHSLQDRREIWIANHEHEAQLRVLTNSQANSVQALNRIEHAMDRQDEKLDELVREKRGS